MGQYMNTEEKLVPDADLMRVVKESLDQSFWPGFNAQMDEYRKHVEGYTAGYTESIKKLLVAYESRLAEHVKNLGDYVKAVNLVLRRQREIEGRLDRLERGFE